MAIAKDNTMFCLPEQIETYAGDVFDRLTRDRQLQGLPRDVFAQRLADYFGDLNAVHPFREGNGRAQRLMFGQLAGAAGYEIQWHNVTAERNIAVCAASARGDERPLRELLEQITEPIGPNVARTARALQAAYGERERLASERAQLPNPPRRDRTRPGCSMTTRWPRRPRRSTRFMRRSAMTILEVITVERVEIKLTDDLQRQQQLLITIAPDEVLSHAPIVLNPPYDTTVCAKSSTTRSTRSSTYPSLAATFLA